MSRVIDLSNRKFGMWTVLRRGENDNGGSARWVCQCECGTISIVSSSNLLRGCSTNCGCVRRQIKPDSKCRERLYKIHSSMRNRCSNPNNYSYKHYGGRGITVCKEWLGKNGYENFKEWALNNGYSEGLTIDRIDVNGDYEPSNCRWVTVQQQSCNTRASRIFEYGGETHILKEWAMIYGINYNTLKSRIDVLGWDFEKAISVPTQKQRGRNC